MQDYAPWAQELYFEVPLWAWIALPVLFITSISLMGPLVRTVLGVIDRVAQKAGRGSVFKRYIASLRLPLTLFATTLVFDVVNNALPYPKELAETINKCEMLLYVLAAVMVVTRYSHYFFDKLKQKFLRSGNTAAAATIPLFRKIGKTVAWVLAILFLLQNFGFDIAAIMAALGVGGIAVALASQKSVENLFGGVVLALDQPIRVGDFGKFGDYKGTVEDIGLRSVRIRTLSRTIVSIPNASFADMSIETYTVRDMMWFNHIVGLRYETTADQIRYIVVEMRKMLLAHPKVSPDPSRVRFMAYNNYSQDIELFAYVLTDDYNIFMEIQEDLLLRIRDIVEASGSDFAFPSTTIYFERGSGLPKELQDKIGGEVRKAREAHTLQWPDIPHQEQERIMDTTPYPPKGSAICDNNRVDAKPGLGE